MFLENKFDVEYFILGNEKWHEMLSHQINQASPSSYYFMSKYEYFSSLSYTVDSRLVLAS